MKTTKTILFCAAICLSASSYGQAGEKKAGTGKEIAFSTQAEKDARIKTLEAKLAVDQIDQTFPVADLEKEKQELARTKKAKVTALKK